MGSWVAGQIVEAAKGTIWWVLSSLGVSGCLLAALICLLLFKGMQALGRVRVWPILAAIVGLAFFMRAPQDGEAVADAPLQVTPPEVEPSSGGWFGSLFGGSSLTTKEEQIYRGLMYRSGCLLMSTRDRDHSEIEPDKPELPEPYCWERRPVNGVVLTEWQQLRKLNKLGNAAPPAEYWEISINPLAGWQGETPEVMDFIDIYRRAASDGYHPQAR